MLDILKSILFGIIEGITEWLPVSSTGHLIILENFIKFDNVSPNFWSMFEVVIQFGAILAVVVLFWNKIFPFTNDPKKGYTRTGVLSHVKPNTMVLWFKIAVACLPAVFYKVITKLLDIDPEAYFYNYLSVAAALIIFGVAFILVENMNEHRRPKITKLSNITYKYAFIIGMFQLLAGIFPGTSRSGATIIGALLIGISRSAAAEFTFFLAIPVMFGASLFEVTGFGASFSGTEVAILITGIIVSFIVSMLVIGFLMKFIKKHNFKCFGYYRIGLGILLILYFIGTKIFAN